MLQLGFFIFFNLLAFGFLFYGLKGKKETLGSALFIFSMTLFFVLGFSMFEQDIQFQTNYIDSFGMNITATNIFIGQDETYYLIYVYWGMALIAFLAFMFSRGPGGKF